MPKQIHMTLPPLLGTHHSIEMLRKSIARWSQVDQPLVIIGEPGVGKTLLTSYIHDNSALQNNALIRFNAAMCNDRDQRTILFGGEPPMLTTTRKGALERETTLLIKNADELQPYLQRELATALIRHQTKRPGSTESRPVLCRTIFTFTVPLRALGERHSVTESLKAFLNNSSTVRIPPLRKRTSDIPLLAKAFFNRFRKQKTARVNTGNTRAIPISLSPHLRSFLMSQSWPANITQLKAFLRCLIVPSYEDVMNSTEYQKVNEMLTNIEEGMEFSLSNSMRVIEEAMIARAIAQTEGNIRQAGYLLGLDESRIHRRKPKVSRPG